jgi:hypothetical protein
VNNTRGAHSVYRRKAQWMMKTVKRYPNTSLYRELYPRHTVKGNVIIVETYSWTDNWREAWESRK